MRDYVDEASYLSRSYINLLILTDSLLIIDKSVRQKRLQVNQQRLQLIDWPEETWEKKYGCFKDQVFKLFFYASKDY